MEPAPDDAGPAFPGTPSTPGELPQFGESPGLAPVQSSIAGQVKRRSRGRKSGMWFPVICGFCLVGGIGWLYLNLGPSISGERIAYVTDTDAQSPRLIDNGLITVAPDVRQTVLDHFRENTERLRSSLVETEFSATKAGLQVRVLVGNETKFFRFPIDEELRQWYDANFDALEASRARALKKDLKSFFTDWEVAIRNQEGVEDFIVYRDSVGLASSVNGLGFNVSAKIGQTLYPCVYEDDGFLYFLLPDATKKFRIVGFRANGRKSLFPGEYQVTVRPPKKS